MCSQGEESNRRSFALDFVEKDIQAPAIGFDRFQPISTVSPEPSHRYPALTTMLDLRQNTKPSSEWCECPQALALLALLALLSLLSLCSDLRSVRALRFLSWQFPGSVHCHWQAASREHAIEGASQRLSHRIARRFDVWAELHENIGSQNMAWRDQHLGGHHFTNVWFAARSGRLVGSLESCHPEKIAPTLSDRKLETYPSSMTRVATECTDVWVAWKRMPIELQPSTRQRIWCWVCLSSSQKTYFIIHNMRSFLPVHASFVLQIGQQKLVGRIPNDISKFQEGRLWWSLY